MGKAVLAVRESQLLLASHLAEFDTASMTRIEKEMDGYGNASSRSCPGGGCALELDD
ncbi:MAG TPA: hypothetical protein VIV60_32260 [Polyangiaceae bacterium]